VLSDLRIVPWSARTALGKALLVVALLCLVVIVVLSFTGPEVGPPLVGGISVLLFAARGLLPQRWLDSTTS
jgi:hypothetical protein